jgi:hypothetical protein
LIAVRFAESDHSGVDIFAKRAIECAPPDENSDIRLLAITTGSGCFGRHNWGPMLLGPRIRDWAWWGLPDDGRQIQGAFRFAHFRAAKGFTLGAANRVPAQRPSQPQQ